MTFTLTSMKKNILQSAAAACHVLAVFAATSAASLVLGQSDSSGGGVTLLTNAQYPSVGGPSQEVISQVALHGSAPVALSSMLIDRLILALLLICIGYALHAFVADHEHAPVKRRAKRSR